MTTALASLASSLEQCRASTLTPAEEEAARALVADLRSLFHTQPAAAPPPGAAQAAAPAEPLSLLSLPPEMAVAVLKRLAPRDLASVERTCHALGGHVPPPPSLVELAL